MMTHWLLKSIDPIGKRAVSKSAFCSKRAFLRLPHFQPFLRRLLHFWAHSVSSSAQTLARKRPSQKPKEHQWFWASHRSSWWPQVGLLGRPFGDPGGPRECAKAFFLSVPCLKGLRQKPPEGMHLGPPLGTLSGGPFPYTGRQNSSAGIGFEPHRSKKGGSGKRVPKIKEKRVLQGGEGGRNDNESETTTG